MVALNDIVSQMRQALALSDPDLDTSVGTTTRKILDAVAEVISESYLDQHLLSYQYDIDSKYGGDLDDFCALFGIVRYGAKRGSGTVTFIRDAAESNQVLLIQVNTQVASTTSPQVTVVTMAPAFMDLGVRTATVPVQAVDGGPLGNVGAGTLTRLVSPVQGISVSNIQALTGGAPQETDDALRLRWKQTVFRNLAGTEQMYLGIALADGLSNDPGCTRANVVGTVKTRREQVQISGGVATSDADDVAYVYPSGVTLGPDIDAGQVLVEGLDYTFDSNAIPPVVHNNGGLVEGDIYDLVYQYVPQASRNLPASGISNRIDVWCNGIRPLDATQTIVFKTALRFTTTTTDPYYLSKFVRPDGSNPTNGNIFIPLAYGPIISLPATLTINAQTYAQVDATHPFGTVDNTDPAHPIIYAYSIIHEDIPNGWGAQSQFGMEWDQNHLPTNGSVVVVGEGSGTGDPGYTFNVVPTDIQTAIDNWRLLGTDARAHQAKQQYLRFNLAIIVDSKVERETIYSNIRQALTNYCNTLGFDAVVQVNEALRAVLNAVGVVNARFLTGADVTGWAYANRNNFATGIQRVVNGTAVETYLDSNGRPYDVSFGDAELPVFNDLGGGTTANTPNVRAQNTFGSI